MVIKFISLILAVCSIELAVVAAQSPADPLLLIISGDPVVSAIRLVLVAAAVRLAFKARYKYKFSRDALIGGGTIMMAAGLCGMLSQSITDELSVYIKYMDFWALFLIGLVFALSALTSQAGNRKLKLKPSLFKLIPKTWTAKTSPYLASQPKQKTAV
ncbi:MAG TPA: hypothetical protein VFW52_00065 [Candidatus Saccharimonadales bacterium]|nr:hypothetical protein [Candidatus Saccharimonadales bacterium]